MQWTYKEEWHERVRDIRVVAWHDDDDMYIYIYMCVCVCVCLYTIKYVRVKIFISTYVYMPLFIGVEKPLMSSESVKYPADIVLNNIDTIIEPHPKDQQCAAPCVSKQQKTFQFRVSQVHALFRSFWRMHTPTGTNSHIYIYIYIYS